MRILLTLMIKWGTPILENPTENGTVIYDLCVDDPCINMYNEDGTCLVDGRVFSTHLTCVLHWFLTHFNWNFTVPIVCFVSCRFRYTSDTGVMLQLLFQGVRWPLVVGWGWGRNVHLPMYTRERYQMLRSCCADDVLCWWSAGRVSRSYIIYIYMIIITTIIIYILYTHYIIYIYMYVCMSVMYVRMYVM